MDFTQLLQDLGKGFAAFTWGNAVMMLVGLVLIYLAIWKEYEPVLLLPIGFGCLIANLGMSNEVGFMKVIYDAGIKTELFLGKHWSHGRMTTLSPTMALTRRMPLLTKKYGSSAGFFTPEKSLLKCEG